MNFIAIQPKLFGRLYPLSCRLGGAKAFRLFILCDLSQGVASLSTMLFGLKPIQRKGVYQVLSRMKIEDTIRYIFCAK
jgi:hypothetical protein